MANEQDKKINAEEVAGKIREALREELVAITSVDGAVIHFRLPNGQQFRMTVEEA